MGSKLDFFHGFESRTFPVGSGSNPNLPGLCLLLAVLPKFKIKIKLKQNFLLISMHTVEDQCLCSLLGQTLFYQIEPILNLPFFTVKMLDDLLQERTRST
jgi:hypothetical protein